MIENNIVKVKEIIKNKCVEDLIVDPEGGIIFIYNDGTRLTIKTYSYQMDINIGKNK